MTDGVYVNYSRTKTKKSLKEAAKRINDGGDDVISIECTSLFGGFSGDIKNAEVGHMFTVVGPDPLKRVWFANVIWDGKKIIVK